MKKEREKERAADKIATAKAKAINALHKKTEIDNKKRVAFATMALDKVEKTRLQLMKSVNHEHFLLLPAQVTGPIQASCGKLVQITDEARQSIIDGGVCDMSIDMKSLNAMVSAAKKNESVFCALSKKLGGMVPI